MEASLLLLAESVECLLSSFTSKESRWYGKSVDLGKGGVGNVRIGLEYLTGGGWVLSP